MSGGALEYGYGRIDDLADRVEARARTPLHRAFAAHLRLCAKAAKDLEWMLSCDTSAGTEVAALEKVISPEMVLALTIEEAKIARENLDIALERARGLAE